MDIVKQVLDKVLGSHAEKKHSGYVYPMFFGTSEKDKNGKLLYTGVFVFEDLLVPVAMCQDDHGIQEYIEEANLGRIVSSWQFWFNDYTDRYEMIMLYLQIYLNHKLPTKVEYTEYSGKIIYDYSNGTIEKWTS